MTNAECVEFFNHTNAQFYAKQVAREEMFKKQIECLIGCGEPIADNVLRKNSIGSAACADVMRWNDEVKRARELIK